MRGARALRESRANAGGSLPSRELLTTLLQIRSFARGMLNMVAMERLSRYPLLRAWDTDTPEGGNGPGAVVAKGDKLFTIEFSGIGSGAVRNDQSADPGPTSRQARRTEVRAQ